MVLILATSTTSVVALTSSHVREGFVRACFWLSALTIVLAVIAAATDEQWFLNIASVIQISLLAIAMAAVLWRVVTSVEVGSRTILGAISVYAVLGILFTFAYGTIDRIQGGPFFEEVAHPVGSDFLFFSYTTLTTTGYGNLVPGGSARADDRRPGDDDRPDLPRHPGRRTGQPLAAGRGPAAPPRTARSVRARPPEAPGRQPWSSSTRSIVCGSSGLSPPSVGTDSIASTTSMPSITSPKTVCLPSSQGAAPVVTMKNWDPLVFGTGVGHRQRPAHDLVVVELVLEGVAGPAAAGAFRAAALDHEVRDHPVEDELIVEPIRGELAEVLDGFRRVLVVKLEHDRPGAGVKGRLRHGPNPNQSPVQPWTRIVTGGEDPGT